MFELSRLLELAGTITWRPNGGKRRRPIRGATVTVEELEARVVPTLLGQQLFPSDYPWNQNISGAPLAANSAAVIAHIGSSIKIHPDWGQDSASNGSSPLYGIPVNVVHGNSVAKVNVVIDNYPGESDVIAVPIPPNAVVEGDYQNGPNPNGGGYNSGQRGDSHLIVWDEDNNIAYELYGVTRPADPKLFPNTSGVELAHTDGKWHAAQESVWNMNTNSFRTLGDTSADAAGLSILAGLARPDEGLPASQNGQGAINHAIRFTLPSGDVNPQYIYPASHVVSASSGTTKLPFGVRLRLANTPAVNAAIQKMGPEAQILATAMQQYGLVLADIGSAMYITGSSGSVDANNSLNLTWNMSDVLGLTALTAGDFEVVDLTPRVTGLSATGGPAGTTVTVVGQNFSGAAGHLSVFFGSVAATSVTYVDDSHLTAVVPNGSGTVHVTVQSGVNKTDPNKASNNVNAPVFGYGTSAASAADQFTYGATIIPGPVAGNPPSGNPPTSSGNAPTINAIGPQTVADGGTLTFGITAAGTGAPFTFNLAAGAPVGAGINAQTGQFTWTPAQSIGIAPGAYVITVRAAGSAGVGSATFTVTVGPSSTNQGSGRAARDLVANGLTQSAEYYGAFVNGAYHKYLGRGPEQAGLAYWVALMQNGLSDEQLEAGFIGSAEFIANHGGGGAPWVQGLYQSLLGRAPLASEVQYWVDQLAAGTTPQQVALGFAASAERESQRVQADYQQYLGRSANAAEVSYWVNVFLNGGSNEKVNAGFLSSPEYFQQHGGNIVDWLFAGYRAVLNREPDAVGYQSWLNQLQ